MQINAGQFFSDGFVAGGTYIKETPESLIIIDPASHKNGTYVSSKLIDINSTAPVILITDLNIRSFYTEKFYYFVIDTSLSDSEHITEFLKSIYYKRNVFLLSSSESSIEVAKHLSIDFFKIPENISEFERVFFITGFLLKRCSNLNLTGNIEYKIKPLIEKLNRLKFLYENWNENNLALNSAKLLKHSTPLVLTYSSILYDVAEWFKYHYLSLLNKPAITLKLDCVNLERKKIFSAKTTSIFLSMGKNKIYNAEILIKEVNGSKLIKTLSIMTSLYAIACFSNEINSNLN